MPKKVCMMKIKAVTRLLAQGLSCREISQQTGVSRSSVSRLSQKLPKELKRSSERATSVTEDELKALVKSPEIKSHSSIDFESVYKKLQSKYVTLRLVYENFYSQEVTKPYSYQHFCALYRKWEKEHRRKILYANLEPEPGQSMEIDFAGDRQEWTDGSGEKHGFKLFVASMPYSQAVFVRACEDEKRTSWLIGINEAYFYFGGVAETLVCDNAKALINHNDGVVVEYGRELQAICEHFGSAPLACDVYRPRQKNRVENNVNNVYRQIMAKMLLADKNLYAESLEELNERLRKCCDEFNQKPFTNRPGSRAELFEVERKLLKPLPAQPYQFLSWKQLTVDCGHCVKISPDDHRYSVPAEYVGKKVLVQLSTEQVVILEIESGLEIARHERCQDLSKGRTHLLPEHLTEAEKYMLQDSSDFKELFLRRGLSEQNTEKLLSIVKRQGMPKLIARNKLRSLLRLYSDEPMDPAYKDISINLAIENALAHEEIEPTLIRLEALRLAQELSSFAEPSSPDPKYKTLEHENTRKDSYH